MNTNDENEALPEEVKASVIGSGVLATLKNVTNPNASKTRDENLQNLQQQVQTAIDDIAQKLNTGKLDDSTSIKLSTLMLKLQGALHKSSSALAAALSEAMAAIGDPGSAAISVQQKTEQLWQRVDTDNKAISDDFGKIQEAGVKFNGKLWDRHKELMQALQDHPHDLKTQKELDAVDDALLMQAESQLKQCPEAKQFFYDAKKKSDDRHQVVDKDLAGVAKKESLSNNISMADFDQDTPAPGAELTMHDVASQSVGQKPKSVGKQQG